MTITAIVTGTTLVALRRIGTNMTAICVIETQAIGIGAIANPAMSADAATVIAIDRPEIACVASML